MVYVRSLEKLDSLESYLVDEKVTYQLILDEKRSTSSRWNCEVLEKTDEIVKRKLEELSIISSQQSRFRADENVKNELVDKMYKVWVNKIQEDEKSAVIVAKNNDSQIMGMVTIKEILTTYSVELVGVFPQFHRLGVARAMMEKCIHIANKNKIRSVSVVTQATNEAACGLYESLGFKNIDCRYIYHIHKVG